MTRQASLKTASESKRCSAPSQLIASISKFILNRKELPVYALVVAPGGPKMEKNTDQLYTMTGQRTA
jgi:hypothetical protein